MADALLYNDKYYTKMVSMIQQTGGEVKGQYVLSPGCGIIEETTITELGKLIFNEMNIDTDTAEYEQIAEFNGRLTYLSFRDEKKSSVDFNTKMTQELQHLSVYGSISVTFLLVGIALETSLELIAHTEAKVARLTSSATKAMDHPLYVLGGSPEEIEAQKKYLEKVDEVSKTCLKLDDKFRETCNMLKPGTKATALTYTMVLKDYHKLFIGRLPIQGNEVGVREICERMCRQLSFRYPMVIKTPEEYQGKNNGEKYDGGK